MHDELLRVREAAQLLALSRSKVYEEIGAGRLRSVTIGRARRVPRSAVVEYVAMLLHDQVGMTPAGLETTLL
jgi:excisionase family DNA binding protein